MGRSKRNRKCPRCSSKNILFQDRFDDGAELYVCADCDHEFEIRGSGLKRRAQDFEVDEDFDSDDGDVD